MNSRSHQPCLNEVHTSPNLLPFKVTVFFFWYVKSICRRSLLSLWLQWTENTRELGVLESMFSCKALCWRCSVLTQQIILVNLWKGDWNYIRETQELKATWLFSLYIGLLLWYNWLHIWRNGGDFCHWPLGSIIGINFAEVQFKRPSMGLDILGICSTDFHHRPTESSLIKRAWISLALCLIIHFHNLTKMHIYLPSLL